MTFNAEKLLKAAKEFRESLAQLTKATDEFSETVKNFGEIVESLEKPLSKIKPAPLERWQIWVEVDGMFLLTSFLPRENTDKVTPWLKHAFYVRTTDLPTPNDEKAMEVIKNCVFIASVDRSVRIKFVDNDIVYTGEYGVLHFKIEPSAQVLHYSFELVAL